MYRTALALIGLAALAAAIVVLTTRSAGGAINPVTAYDADINKDGTVGFADLLALGRYYNQAVPTFTSTPSPTATTTPSATPTPLPYQVSLVGPKSVGYEPAASVGSVVTYTLTVRNRGPEAATANLNSFSSQLIGENQQDVFTILCVATGLSTGSATGCISFDQFNAAGVNGLGYGGTILPGESAWATFVGYFNTTTGQTPMLVSTTWHYNNSSLAVAGNVNAVVYVEP